MAAQIDTNDFQIALLLEAEPERLWGYDDIRSQLPEIPRASIRVYLYKLQKEHKVKKMGRGKWKSLTAEDLLA